MGKILDLGAKPEPAPVPEFTTGTGTFSGNAIATSFLIAHGLGVAPGFFQVQEVSAGAANVSYATADATNITVFYGTAPATGTGNVVIKWMAKA